ncbi:MAG: alginate lyase family protein [Thermodesulfobacteriota bacterium]|nr:alginate lyase family protein [Thermodesulfobacteriota bacterium]
MPCNDLNWNKNINFFYDSKDISMLIEHYKKLFPIDAFTEMQNADDLVARSFHLLNYDYDFRKSTIEWHLDPVSNRSWEKIFFADIVFKGKNRLGDIKFPWELSKLQYLALLGKAYWLTKNERYTIAYKEHVTSWIVKNPIYIGIHWISGLEMGMRIISLIISFYFFKNSALIDKEYKELLFCSIYIQANHIYENLSLFPNANNHLIGEAAALVFSGLFLESQFSKIFLQKGINILENEIKKQFFEDGINKEQSPNYHRLSLDYYYLTQIILQKNGKTFSEDTLKRMEKATEALMYILKPDRRAPFFGDGDDARGFFFYEGCQYDYRGLLNLGAVLFGRGDMKYIGNSITQDVLWLMGIDGIEKYSQIQMRTPEKLSKSFLNGGYYVMRDYTNKIEDYLILDCGPLGHGLAGHGHADALSFQFYSDGFTYLVDPGTYSYNIDYEWRDYFRSTPAHNTITVDECNQSEINDRMSWKTFAYSTCNLWLNTDWFDIVVGEHNGYQRLDDPVLHRRLIFNSKGNYWIIVDMLECRKAHTFDYHLHLHPDASLEFDRLHNQIEVISPKGKRITIELIEDKVSKLDVKIFNGDYDTKLGWFSDSYGLKRPTNTIRLRKDAKGDTIFFTLLNTSSISYRLDMIYLDCSTVYFSVYNPITSITDKVFFSTDSVEKTKSDTFSFKGCFLYVKEDLKKTYCIYAKDFKRLILERGISLHSNTVVDRLEFSGSTYKITTKEDDFDLQVKNHLTKKIFINGKPHIMKY